MYAEIHAKSDIEGSPGKTSWLNTGERSPIIELKTDKPEHIGKPVWYVQLRAKSQRLQGTGERGGEERMTDYDLQVQLKPEELAAIVDFAFKNGLVAAVAAGGPSRSRKARK